MYPPDVLVTLSKHLASVRSMEARERDVVRRSMLAWSVFTVLFFALLALSAATGTGSASLYLSVSAVLAIMVSLCLTRAAELTRERRPPLSAWLRVFAAFWTLVSLPLSTLLAYEVFGFLGIVLILLIVAFGFAYQIRHQSSRD